MENIEKQIEKETAKKMANYYKVYGCTFENHWTEHRKGPKTLIRPDDFPTQHTEELKKMVADDIIIVHWYGKKEGSTRDFEHSIEMVYIIKDNKVIDSFDKFN